MHIPFCVKKCAYCDFLSGPADDQTKRVYVDAVVREMESMKEKYSNYRVDTVFLGGGLPSWRGAGPPGFFMRFLIILTFPRMRRSPWK